MKSRLKRWPSWTREALQGVTYWIGHRRCLYRDYALSEGALVAEICNLIYANLPDDFVLMCEVQYSRLIGYDERPTELTERARADLVVAEKESGTGTDPVPRFVIESSE